jgi:hypothetical protein
MKHSATVILVLLLSTPLSVAAAPQSAPQPATLSTLAAAAPSCSGLAATAVPAFGVLQPSDFSAQLPPPPLPGPSGYCCDLSRGVICRYMSAVVCSDDGGTPYSSLAMCQKNCF